MNEMKVFFKISVSYKKTCICKFFHFAKVDFWRLANSKKKGQS